MPIAETSLLAYYNTVLPTLNRRQREVLDAFTKKEEFTNQELADFLGWGINRVTPRVKELRNGKLLKYSRTRACKVTGFQADVWTLKWEPRQETFI